MALGCALTQLGQKSCDWENFSGGGGVSKTSHGPS